MEYPADKTAFYSLAAIRSFPSFNKLVAFLMSYCLDYIVFIAVVSINKWEYFYPPWSRHLHISHNEPCFTHPPPPAPPPKKNKYVFNFSRDHCNTQEKLKTKDMQNFRGQTSCIMGDINGE